MKRIAPTLAAVLMAPAAFGAVADDLQIKVKLAAQIRATALADATDELGKSQDFYASSAANGSESETSRFGIRRTRLTIEAKNTTGWFGNATLRADNVGTSGTASSGSAPVTLYYAYAGKTFKVGETMEHEIRLGLDKSYNNESSISSSAALFATERNIGTVIYPQREAGIGYKFRIPVLTFGLDIQNSANLTRNATAPSASGTNTNPNSGNYGSKPSPAWSFRLEGSPLGSAWMPAKKAESWAGKPGTHLVVGLDLQNSGKTYAVANEERAMWTYGPDVLLHLNGLTALAEYRITKLMRSPTEGSIGGDEADTIEGSHWNFQVGYAIPMEAGYVIEPAIRFSADDWAKNQDEASRWGANSSRDNGNISPTGLLSQGGLTKSNLSSGATNLGSGSQFDLGVNFYWNDQANKTQISYQRWTAEKGDGAARAVVVQHQVTF